MDVFKLAAQLTLNSDGFDRGVKGAEKSGKGLAASLEGTFSKIKKFAAGAISVVALKKGFDAVMDLANATADYGDKVDKQSQALGLSRKAYQEWDYILGQNGASIDSLGISMKTLNALVLDAAAGGKESKTAFAQLGLGIHEIEKLNPEEQFEAVVRAFQKMPAGAQKSALAVKIFGRNGMSLLPLLNQSETSIDELRARAEELGLVMSDDAVDAAVVYGDSLDDLQRTFNAFKYSIGAKILPILTTGIQKVTNYAGKLRKAYDEKGMAGVWDTLVESFRNIKWPTKEEIIGKLQELWAGVKTAATNVLKLVFGESADGGIAWPSPDEIKAKVMDGLTAMWNGVKTLATSILKLAFGETEDGGIAFPSSAEVWAKISGTFSTWWAGLKSLMEAQLKYVLGVPELPDAHTTGELLRGKIEGWWETIKSTIKSVLDWFIPNPKMRDEDGTLMPDIIKVWWNNKVKPKIKDALNFMLGLFDLPDVGAMKDKVIGWWNDVKDAVGELVLNIIPNILGIGKPVAESGVNEAGDSYKVYKDGSTEINYAGGGTSGGRGFAKGLNYVPYDNFHAMLHRGERVLTASQARRSGNGGTDITALLGELTEAVREGVSGAQLNSYMDSTKVTSKANNVTGRKLISRRFAPA